MRPHLREFLNRCAALLPAPEPIVEIGAFQVPGQESIAELRPLFPGKKYIGCDMLPGVGVDRIENIHALSFADASVGTFILADTLEHVADPIRGMREVHRCLREDGVVIFTSVMHFPIHAYPNDYWRYTPEAFRALAEQFPTAAIFYAGDPLFPHTVCGVAAKREYPAEKIEALAGPLAEIRKPAPTIVEKRAGQVIDHLLAQIMPAPPKPRKAGLPSGFLGRVAQPRWWMVSGQWIEGWVHADDVLEIEIVAGENVVHHTKLTRPRPDIAEKLGIEPRNRPISFTDQIELRNLSDYTGPLQMRVVGADGTRRFACESPAGFLLSSLGAESAFIQHSFDRRDGSENAGAASVETDAVSQSAPAQPAAENAPADFAQKKTTDHPLIAALRGRGEPIIVDLGCGFRKRGNVGVDVTSEGTDADLVCRLGFEPLPLADGIADEVFCKDFLEHLPKAYYSESEKKLRYPIIELFNEIWRVLKPGGIFTSLTPCYPNEEIHQDPTHLSVWTEKSMGYFCGKYPVARAYGVRTNFELVGNVMERFYLRAVLRKPAAADAPAAPASAPAPEAG